MTTESPLLTNKEAAEYLKISVAFLDRDRWAGAKIPFVKLGTRSIRYRKKDLDDYIKSKIRQSTSDTGD